MCRVRWGGAAKLRRAIRGILGLKDGDTRSARQMDLRKVFDHFDDDEGKVCEHDCVSTSV